MNLRLQMTAFPYDIVHNYPYPHKNRSSQKIRYSEWPFPCVRISSRISVSIKSVRIEQLGERFYADTDGLRTRFYKGKAINWSCDQEVIELVTQHPVLHDQRRHDYRDPAVAVHIEKNTWNKNSDRKHLDKVFPCYYYQYQYN